MKFIFNRILPGLMLPGLLALGCDAVRVPTTANYQGSSDYRQQLVVDDLEDGDTTINPNLLNSSGGNWGTLTWGDPSNVVNNPFVVAGGAGGSSFAVHIYGTLTDNGDGQYPSFALQCRLNTGSTYDASFFTGVRFDYRAGTSDNANIRRFFITLPELAPLADGGSCTGATGQCGDYHGIFYDPPPTSWTKQALAFSSLTQEGFGISPSPADLDGNKDHLFWMQWNHGGGNVAGSYTIDYWVDNVEFY